VFFCSHSLAAPGSVVGRSGCAEPLGCAIVASLLEVVLLVQDYLPCPSATHMAAQHKYSR
jgi:hypothetical protein